VYIPDLWTARLRGQCFVDGTRWATCAGAQGPRTRSIPSYLQERRGPLARNRQPRTFFSNPRWGVLSRSLAAIFGGYALASATSVFCAVALPGARGQTVLTGMLLAILVAACARCGRSPPAARCAPGSASSRPPC
jgi:hypothetical protein